MNKTILLTLLASCYTLTNLSAQGIRFEKGHWADVLAKARKENRLVYLDMSSNGCIPCEMLVRDVFPQKEAGDYYNAHFVNYRLNADVGEGTRVNEQYNIAAYPAHLFVDPANNEVVFRTAGYTNVASFVHHGEIAEQERADPMTAAHYRQQFATKKQDTAFLKNYLQKLHRLEQENDVVLDAYLETFPAGPLDTGTIRYLGEHVRSAKTKAFDRLLEQRADYEQVSHFRHRYVDEIIKRWIYRTFSIANADRDSSLAQRAFDLYARYREDEGRAYAYRELTAFWNGMGNPARAEQAIVEEAAYLMNRSDAEYDEADRRNLALNMDGYRQQVQVTDKVPDSLLDQAVARYLSDDPTLSHMARSVASNHLNEIAWDWYEHAKGGDTARASARALSWAKRAVELAEGIDEDWVPAADTYARLLYATGQKTEAIRLMEQTVPRARVEYADDLAEYEETLNRMKAGTL